jgi:glycosyltransferase involved in cell wall biosynthesis
MRVAVNARFLIPGKLEGLGWYTFELLSRLTRLYPDWEFVLLYDRPHDHYLLTGDNIRHVVVFPPARHPVLWYFWFEWSLPRALKKIAPDVFFSPDSYLSLRTPIRTVMVVHDIAYLHYPQHLPLLVRAYYQFFCPRFFRRADTLLTISNFVKKDLLAHFPLDSDNIQVVYNGCREGFKPLRENERAAVREQYSGGVPYFLYWGALQPRKNIARLIEAFSSFRSRQTSPVRLLIGGRKAWKTKEAEQAWAASPFQEDIVFTGYLPEMELYRVVAAAHAVVYVSLFEGFGLPLVEAMHAEVPILSSTVTSLPEVAGDAALLVNPSEVEAIAEGMERLWTDPELCAVLVASGRRQRERFSWNQAARAVGQLLE